MKKLPGYLLVIAILTLTGLSGLLVSDGVAAQELPETTFVTSPKDGEKVSGLITVTGAADFSDFLKYEILLKQGDQLSWGATVYAPVINGVLAWIDTRTFLDGTYNIVIRKVSSDSNYTDVIGPAITIENGMSPVMYPEIDSSPLYPVEGFALARIRNCSGDNLEFDYQSPDGFCSGQDHWIMFKEAHSDYCPAVDILLIPCEYRGTAIGQGASVGANYEFRAEAGKIYEINFPGGDRLYINQIEGDPRASTDTGGLSRSDPARPQPEAAPKPGALPESGQEASTTVPFVGVGSSLILLMIIGGIAALRKRNNPA
jgi:hypothetical protein